jgi:hypothetical protein
MRIRQLPEVRRVEQLARPIGPLGQHLEDMTAKVVRGDHHAIDLAMSSQATLAWKRSPCAQTKIVRAFAPNREAGRSTPS